MVGPRVAIVEDHALVAETLRLALQQVGVSVRIVEPGPIDPTAGSGGGPADAGSTGGLLRALLADPPDLVLLDLDLGAHGDSTALIAPLVQAGVRVLVVTGSDDRLRIAEALQAGAIGYRSKAAGFDALLEATRAALVTERPLDPALRVELLEELLRHRDHRRRDLAPFEALTAREAETLRALCAGLSVGDIARARVVSEATVRSQVKAVLDKLGVHSQLAAVAAAARAGWPDTSAERPGPPTGLNRVSR